MDVVHPRYGAETIAEVLPGVLSAFGLPGVADPLGLAGGPLAGVRRVAMLLVDGLGCAQLPLAAPYAPTLAEFAAGRLGTVRTITSGFPSTTPTSLVSIGTGAPPGQHGVIGFNVRVPATGRILNHIQWWDDPDPKEWQPVPTQFDRAAAAGIPVTVVSRAEFAGSGLTVAAYRGADYRGAAGVDALATEMLAVLNSEGGLVYGYHPDLDRAGHTYGLASNEWAAAAGDVDRLLTRLIEGLPSDAALVVTADHGQLDIPADGRLDLDTDPRLRTGVEAAAGEPRVRYLYTLPGARDDVIAAWRAVLGDGAWIVPREEAVAAGWFGPVPEEHLARVGDVVVACHDSNVVVATRSEPEFVARMVAFHGSYTAAEMRVPLFVAGGASSPNLS
ncbi:alkaline phosphatase family protein [Planosporangium flavigriseum]|uniref:Alkaline phosphatase family protein n=1 Tax=Planosporangium flavigriseum TaxID=373681 RepID=A0A8J3LFQ0_9ACTN|nr:nucleotide pyrophosphatase/phosphodiesterase family protein [Planosporangium flavigriseum]NJC63230.1 alkaline phosphatase family protein [Planosporangium flavigriseum]GIG72503.1 alkaline phosphatase family protein [Planosporangium flavigriseum]